MTRLPAFSLLVALLVTAGAEEPVRVAEADGPRPGILDRAPAKARARSNPFANERDAAEAGGKLFIQHCAQCHGAAAQGGKKAPGLHTPAVRQAAPGALFWVLTNGDVRHGMPPWSKLPEPQRWQIVTFLEELEAPACPPESRT